MNRKTKLLIDTVLGLILFLFIIVGNKSNSDVIKLATNLVLLLIAVFYVVKELRTEKKFELNCFKICFILGILL